MSVGSARSTSGMGKRAVSGAAVLGISQIIKLILTILSAVVIARLLSPTDYGVVAMVTPVIAFITMFQDLGLSAAAIQRKSITHEQSSALFWINVYASFVVAGILILVSPLVGLFYGDTRPAYVTAVTSIAIIITGFGLQQTAYLNRNFRFSTISLAEVASAIANFITSAILAVILRSYWALVAGTIAGSLVQLSVLWLKADWRPSRTRSVKPARDLLGFGSHVTATNIMNYFVRNADNVLIAKFQGASALGLYDRSYKLMMLPIQSINTPLSRLLLPNLSSLQNDPIAYRKAFGFAIFVLMIIISPGVLVATIYSDKLMPFLLGPQWSATSEIFFWLGLTGIIQPIANMTGVLFLSTGRTKVMLKWGLFSAIITIIGFVAGLPWGPEGVAAALFVTAIFRLPILFWLSSTGTPVLLRDLYFAQLIPLGGGLVGAGLSWTWSDSFSAAAFFGLSIPVTYLCSLAGALVTSPGRNVLRQASDLLKNLVVRQAKIR